MMHNVSIMINNFNSKYQFSVFSLKNFKLSVINYRFICMFSTPKDLVTIFYMAKYLAQLVIAGARVLGRAFTQALKEEYAASQQAANARRTSQNSGDSNSSRTFSQIAGISLEESKQILNIKDIHDLETLKKNYDHLFSVNAKDKGGSLYLQSKVFRAKERIDEELQLESMESKRKQSPHTKSSDTT